MYSLTEWQYDNAGRTILEKGYATPHVKGASPSGGAAANSYAYNIDSSVSEITHNGTGKTSYLYNNDGLVSRETKLLSGSRAQRVDYAYNYLGKATSETIYQEQNALDGKPDNTTLFGITTNYSYDANGNLTTVAYPNGAVLNYEYDALNQQTHEKRAALNENGTTVNVQKTKAYNNIGKIASETDEKGYSTNYTYNALGFLVRVALPNNAITSYEYDRQGRKTKEYSPRALLGDEPGNVIAPPGGTNNWLNPCI